MSQKNGMEMNASMVEFHAVFSFIIATDRCCIALQ